MTDPKHPEGTNAADAIAGLAITQVIAEQAAAYYCKLADAGVPDESAARMTEEYHGMLIALATAGANLGQPPTGGKFGRRT